MPRDSTPLRRLDWLADALADWEKRGLRRTLPLRESAQGATIQVAGRQLVNLGSNDYLNLAADPRVVHAAVEAAKQHGVGAGASPLVTGRSAIHAQLEESLAQFEGTETSLLFPTGFAANLGTICALVGEGDLILSDEQNHASIIDGCRLSRAEVAVYPHGDVISLRKILRSTKARRMLIVTDGLFSMGGDLASLRELADIADEFDVMLMVDEAHATGVLGPYRRGASEYLGVEERVDIRVGTLSKGLGSVGGFVSGSRLLIEWLLNQARSYIFSTALPAPVCAAAIAALDIVRSEPERGTRLLETATWLRSELVAQGWQLGAAQFHILPVLIGDPVQTMDFAHRLVDRGYFVPGIRPPSVPQGKSLLRMSLTCGHTREMLAGLLAALDEFPRPKVTSGK
jgi:8-amino-7-oxononanoate synthase